LQGIIRLAERAKSLEEVLRKEAVPIMLEILENDNGSLRYSAANALKAIGLHKEHREPLTSVEQLFSSGDADQRESAAIAFRALAADFTPDEASRIANSLWSVADSSAERPSTRECCLGVIGSMLSKDVLDHSEQVVRQMKTTADEMAKVVDTNEDLPRVRIALSRALGRS